ncbi:histidinol dehydrogenase [Lacticaseibacillus nasuensis]|uniref:Histidinol dehydrogenase n=1 Tax=Lacticaseibacillus nasuensis JCM 17158 TaxID=1291734 RepID=A0A0R1JS39_9LACO|nr:histidinol dehydrogenase [Lacticaseibacillus nasuensis]KRK73928.1 histidinol dehydrogenase [Lacticaseibacillus nasuensis JCM 17158]
MKIIDLPLADTIAYAAKRSAVAASDPAVEASVAAILTAVRTEGDAAIRRYEKQFDNADLTDLRVPQSAIDDAYANAPQDLIAALELAKRNIISYHQKEKATGFVDTEQPGVMRGERITPLAAVGVYVPGGTAAYPSSILMNVLPAKIAGVARIALVTPPQADGLNQSVLTAAKIAGVTEVYQVGGAQAIAALAYGTESIPRVDKITGPGNIFVATAKKQVFGTVSIDMIAGPSEIGVIANAAADPENVAADLLSQAEHDKRSRPMLVTPDRDFATAVSAAIDRQLTTLPREEIARASVENEGFIALVPDLPAAFAVMNAIAPEHLEVQLPDAAQYLSLIQNAGSVFLGFAASEPVGDYVAGPNHILPTGGTSRFFSALGVTDFMKRTQFITYSKAALAREESAITTLARTEGLEAHARAVESRFRNDQ